MRSAAAPDTGPGRPGYRPSRSDTTGSSRCTGPPLPARSVPGAGGRPAALPASTLEAGRRLGGGRGHRAYQQQSLAQGTGPVRDTHGRPEHGTDHHHGRYADRAGYGTDRSHPDRQRHADSARRRRMGDRRTDRVRAEGPGIRRRRCPGRRDLWRDLRPGPPRAARQPRAHQQYRRIPHRLRLRRDRPLSRRTRGHRCRRDHRQLDGPVRIRPRSSANPRYLRTPVLDGWYRLFAAGDPAGYAVLAEYEARQSAGRP